jgi:hypothetical protein
MVSFSLAPVRNFNSRNVPLQSSIVIYIFPSLLPPTSTVMDATKLLGLFTAYTLHYINPVLGLPGNELESSGGSFEPANRRPTPGDGSAPLPASASAVTGEEAAACSWQAGPPEGGVTYAAVLARPVAHFSQLIKPAAMGTYQPETTVSSEIDNMRMYSYMSEPLSDKPDGTTQHAQVANTCLPSGQRPNKKPIFITGVDDARIFMAWWRADCPGGLTAQLKDKNLIVVPLIVDGFRAVVSALRSLDRGGCVLSRSRRTAVCDFW